MSNQKPMKVTPAHLLRALCGIENWIKGVRKVLAQMDPDLEIEITQHLPDWNWVAYGGNIPTIKGCPPPEIDSHDPPTPPQVQGCPPPEWYQDDCPERT